MKVDKEIKTADDFQRVIESAKLNKEHTMDIRFDIMENGMQIIYNLIDDQMIEEPCQVNLHKDPHGSGKIFPEIIPILMLTDNSKCIIHSSSKVLYSIKPNSDLHNYYVDILNQCRAKRSGIVSPTKTQVVNLVK